MNSILNNTSFFAAETDKQSTQDQSAASVKTGKKAPGAFLTISEVAKELDVQQHVLRFWETKFSQLKPLKRGGGRRYYRPEDVKLLKVIHSLLYTDKFTIKGVQKQLKGQSKMQILQGFTANNNVPNARAAVVSNDQEKLQNANDAPSVFTSGMNKDQKELLKGALEDLRELRDIIAKS